MYINIKNDDEYTDDFLNFLKKRMILIGLEYLKNHRKKLLLTNQYLNNNVFKGIRKPSSEQIIIQGLNNIIFKKYYNKIIISIDNVIDVPQCNYINLFNICRLIDQGNIELQPFPIFTYIFDYAKNNIKRIYVDYSYGLPA